MDERIKITMLGASGAGKTCYMIAMYKMMNYGIGLNGFLLSAGDSDDNVRFSSLWHSLVSKGSDRWPSPTSEEITQYDLNFYYARNHILNFDWFDYRGGAIQDYKDAPDVKILRSRLRETSCLLLCVSGEHFSNKLELASYERIAVSGINQLMSETQSSCENNIPPAVVIVITKYDLCKNRPKSEILTELQELFPPLFARQGRWLVMVCPTTLGNTLSTNSQEGSIEPENVHLPVVFSLYAELLKQNWKLIGTRSKAMEELQDLSEGFLSALINRRNINEKEENIHMMEQRIKQLRGHISVMSENLDMQRKVDLFFNGRKVSFNEFFQ